MCTRVLVLLALYVGLAHSFSWEIVVGGGKRLKFYENRTLMHTEIFPFVNEITTITYDPVHCRVLFVDQHNTNMSISSFDLSTRKTQPIITRTLDSYVKTLAYDPVTQLLFWRQRYNIYSLSLMPASSNKAVTENLLFTLDHYCWEIAVDSCGEFIYWVTKFEIERAVIDGSEREVLIYGEVYRRLSLAIDQQTQKMYWIEETTAFQFSIETADLNGKNRKTFYNIGTEMGATALAVSKDFIYWRSYDQRSILQLTKNEQHGVGPIIYSNINRNYWSHRLTAANYTIKEQTSGMKSCEALKSLSRYSSDAGECYDSTYHYFCIHGNCSVSAEGHPKCSCEAGYSGEKCEINACHMYCLHGGVCSQNEKEKPVCQCTIDYEGERCDIATSHTSV